MKYFKRLMALNKVGIEFPDAIKEYVQQVHSILDNLYIGEVEERDRYQLYDKKGIVHFEFRKSVYNKGTNIQVWMLELYKNKFKEYHDFNLYIICDFYNINIDNIEQLSEKHTSHHFRLGYYYNWT